MINIKKALIKIADELDRRGQTDLADEIDQKILPTLEVELEIPEDELNLLKEVALALQESIQ